MSAANAVKVLLTMKHDCEYESKDIDKTSKLRTVILKCKDDARIRLYGYRWLYLDDLRSRQVSFVSAVPQESAAEEFVPGAGEVTAARPGLIQMVDGGLSYFFNSIDESLSFPGLPYNVSHIREKLLTVPESDFANIAGRMWRRFQPGTGRSTIESAMLPSLQNKSPASDADDVTQVPDVVVVKEDLIAGERTLLGFDTKVAAYQDWLQTLDSSAFPYQGPKSMEIFLEFYLDGDRNIDGIRWKTVTKETAGVTSVATVDGTVAASVKVVEEHCGERTQLREAEPNSEPEVAAKESASSENVALSKVFDVESIPSPKFARKRMTLTKGIAKGSSLEKFQLSPVAYQGENGEMTVIGEQRINRSAIDES
jgi:hypothetical protein